MKVNDYNDYKIIFVEKELLLQADYQVFKTLEKMNECYDIMQINYGG